MNSKSEAAAEIFGSGFNCAQAVFSSHSGDYGLDPETARKVSAAFGGGMADNGEVCGAVTGALMLIGLKYGKYIEDDKISKSNSYRIANEYINKFKKEHGSILCRELIKCDLSVSEEREKARETGVFKTICPLLVKRSVELVEEVM